MKDLLVFLHDAANIKNIRNAAVTGIILADRAFSSCADGTDITAEAVDMIHKAGYRAIAKADRLFEQQELDGVSQYLQQLAYCGIDEVIYTDIGVKILLERLNSPMKGIYAPETLLTSAPDIEVLRRDGLDGCVISKDIPLRDACAIMKLIPDYCMLRIHGPILIACSRRRYINAYLETSDREHTDDYFIQEETRHDRLALVEKDSGSWLYGPCLHSVNEIGYLMQQPSRGFIIDNCYLDDDYTLKVLRIYDLLMKGMMTGDEALRQLQNLDMNINYFDINELKETWLEKE